VIGRLVIVCIPIAIYVAVRCAVFYFFLGHSLPKNAAEFFDWSCGGSSRCFGDWWFSWFISIPITALSCFAAGGLFAAIGWVLFGSDDDDEEEDDIHEHSSLR
jgi:hypothetical protein